MFVVELTYVAPMGEIDRAMKEHMAFVREHYASGHFLVSGRKVPRDGGIILAVADTRSEIEAIMKKDPFVVHDLVTFRVTEFLPSQQAEKLAERIR